MLFMLQVPVMADQELLPTLILKELTVRSIPTSRRIPRGCSSFSNSSHFQAEFLEGVMHFC